MAEKYGELIALSEGSMNRYGTNNMHRKFEEILKESSPDDYILMCGLSVMNVIACSIFTHLHGQLNLLMFKDGGYVERNIIFKKE